MREREREIKEKERARGTSRTMRCERAMRESDEKERDDFLFLI